MRLIKFIIVTIFWAFSTHGQEPKKIKGIAVEKTGTPVPYCSVSVKGTKIGATTNNCGEFQLTTGQEEFTIVFSCMSTHDFITFERRINPKEINNDETVVFQLKKHGKIINKECKKTIDKKLKKLPIL
jgi:hypothetical protein